MFGDRLKEPISTIAPKKEVATISSDAKLRDVLEVFNKLHVLSVPVISVDDQHKCLGTVDVADVSEFVASMARAVMDGHMEGPDDRNEEEKAQEAEKRQEQIKINLDAPLQSLIDFSGLNLFLPLKADRTIAEVATFLATGVHRAVLFDADNQMHGICGQSDINAYLHKLMTEENPSKELEEFAKTKITELGFTFHSVTNLAHSATVGQALEELAYTRRQCLAVVDGNTGKIIGNFSASDVRHLASMDITEALNMQLYDYLQRVSPDSLKPVTVKSSCTTKQVVELLAARKLHHVFVEEGDRPCGLISLTDVLDLMINGSMSKPATAQRMLVFVDGSPSSNAAFERALRSKKPEDSLLVVHIVELESSAVGPVGQFGTYANVPQFINLMDQINARKKAQGKQLVARYLKMALHKGHQFVVGEILCSYAPADSAVRFAQKHKIDTMFVGCRGIGAIQSAILGSFSNTVLAAAPCDVMIVRAKKEPLAAPAEDKVPISPNEEPKESKKEA